MNLGLCYYCHEPVEAAQGQSIKYLVRTHKYTKESKSYPTHKKCRP